MELVMEQKYYYIKRLPRLFIWLAIATLLLFALGSIFSNDKFTYTNITLLALGVLYLAQYIFHKGWNIKINDEHIYIRKSLITRPKKIPYAAIISHRLLVTGDLEIKFQNKTENISKDLLEHADFKEILDKINQVTQ